MPRSPALAAKVVASLPGRPELRRKARIAAADGLAMLEGYYVWAARRLAEWCGFVPRGVRPGRTPLERLQASRDDGRLWEKLHDALTRGADPEALGQAIHDRSEEAGQAIADTLRRSAPQMLREHRAADRALRRRLRAVWGPALDRLYQVYVCAEELGSELQQLHGDRDDPLARALLALHARACLVLAEVHALLTAGLPFAAWARVRALHETAVIASVLDRHGREPGTADLAERFWLHAVVDEARDLAAAAAAGLDVGPDELAAVTTARDGAVERFGKEFADAYGWARPLFPSLGPKSRVTFERIESIAQAGLERLDYRLGSHHVHASGRTIGLNSLEYRGTTYRVTGSTNTRLGEPAVVALDAILVSVSALVHGVQELPPLMHLPVPHAIRELAIETAQLFDEAQAQLDDQEERIQARLAARRAKEQP